MRQLAARCTLLILLIAPLAEAGTRDLPEISDPVGDAAAPGNPLPAAQAALDILAVWVTESPLVIHFAVADTVPSGPSDRYEYNADFMVGDQKFNARAWRQASEESTAAGVWADGASSPCGHSQEAGGAMPLALIVDDARAEIAIEIPTSCVAADAGPVALTDAGTYHCHMTPLNVPLSCAGGDTAQAGGAMMPAPATPEPAAMEAGDEDQLIPAVGIVSVLVAALIALAIVGRHRVSR